MLRDLIAKNPLPDDPEASNRALVTAIQAGEDVDGNKQKLFLQNLRILPYYWKRFPHFHFSEIEEMQGYLWEAIEKSVSLYDPAKGDFFNYLLAWLRQWMRRK